MAATSMQQLCCDGSSSRTSSLARVGITTTRRTHHIRMTQHSTLRSAGSVVSSQVVRCTAVTTNGHHGGCTYSPTPPRRRSANYMPNIWDHGYIESSSTTKDGPCNTQSSATIDQLLGYARGMLLDGLSEGMTTTVAVLELVDELQQLGVDWRFREEIKIVMDDIWTRHNAGVLDLPNGCLYSAALLFRLLRQHLYQVSQDVFDTFRDPESGQFLEHLTDDTNALLSLYEASFLATQGEDTLDQARSYTTRHLRAFLQHDNLRDNPDLRDRVLKALELPLHWRVSRLQARSFIASYAKRPDADPRLVELAIRDFNAVQSVHRQELAEASRWWKDLGLAEKLPFCRDRVVENYFCVLGGLSEPRFWYYRKMMTRIFCLIAAMDDIYDIYGTLDELELFTAAVLRWDLAGVQGKLPDCMTSCLSVLFDLVGEIADNHFADKGLHILPYLKQSWSELCESWLVEARWFHANQEVGFQEYLDNSWVSMGWPVVCIHGYFLTTPDGAVNQESAHRLLNNPAVVRCSSTLIRLWNDMSTSKAEMERGDIPKSVQRLIKEEDISELAARERVEELIDNTWKELNGSLVGVESSTGGRRKDWFGREFLDLVMDGSRVLRFIYCRGDGYARPDGETKDTIMSLIFKSIAF